MNNKEQNQSNGGETTTTADTLKEQEENGTVEATAVATAEEMNHSHLKKWIFEAGFYQQNNLQSNSVFQSFFIKKIEGESDKTSETLYKTSEKNKQSSKIQRSPSLDSDTEVYD